jgi:predicted Fe-S protein YdhL (DUF1289 family)
LASFFARALRFNGLQRPIYRRFMASNLHDLPDSPCIGVCSTLFDDVCKGCGRTAGEVSNWVFLTDTDKRAIWERITREGAAMRFTRDKV